MAWFTSLRVQLPLALAICATFTVTLWWFMTSHEHIWWIWLAHWLLCANVITFAYYGLDKLLATNNTWRIPELVLHMLSAIGGSAGAYLAMWLFRHKTIKPTFRILFWVIVVLQAALVVFCVVKWVAQD